MTVPVVVMVMTMMVVIMVVVVMMTMVMMVVTVVMMVTVVRMSSRGTSRERRQAERDGSSQSEHCSTSEHGAFLVELGLPLLHPDNWSGNRCSGFKTLMFVIFHSSRIHRQGVGEACCDFHPHQSFDLRQLIDAAENKKPRTMPGFQCRRCSCCFTVLAEPRRREPACSMPVHSFTSEDHSKHWSGKAGPRVQAIDFRNVFVHLTFMDGARVWQGRYFATDCICFPH